MTTCGIYAIWRAGTKQCYVGSSQSIERRWYHHRRNLRLNQHPSSHLQNAWNKYGENAFVFAVLESCRIEALIQREQYFIEALDSVFNKAIVAGAPMRGRRQSLHQKETLRVKMVGNQHATGHVHSAEWKAANSARHIGKRYGLGFHHTADAKARISAAMIGKKHALGYKQSTEEIARRVASRRSIRTLEGSVGKLEQKYPLATGSI